MFIQTEATPNPNALKFLPGRDVAGEQALEYRTIDEAAASPLAEALFELEGVEGVFFGADYVSVTRAADGPDWTAMKAPILSVVMDHFVSGAPLVRAGAETGRDGAAQDDGAPDSEIVAEIKGLLDTRIRPAVAQDGGDILFDHFDEATGVLRLRMRGACAGCPSSSATLKAGVEQMMRHYVPEVTSVEQVL
ncbi:NifU family protein [Brevundimonas guildfordensis]|uniref:NifU family protein n=1 Tax=Brevundimonas guildfordensis TaxID=2762241 RepID=A0ABR8R365_9CAUL|nr:NifU family protein [Brevundimonas guildfordensis]MBD7942208.1 NifU family protein [Brevundimonas guildfordensis]